MNALISRPFSGRAPSRRQQRKRPQRASQRGVALIEALVSVLIFSFGVLGLIGLEASAINYSVDAEDRNRATLFASDIASTLWLNGTGTYTAAQYSAWQANIANLTLPTGLPGGTLSISPAAGTISTSFNITIQWTPTTDVNSTTRKLTTQVVL
jgi:type IV pilus assembly protein PilV